MMCTFRVEPSLELLLNALRPLAQCVCVYNSTGRCLFANERLARWLDRPQSELIGQPVECLWPEGFARRELADLQQVLTTGRLEHVETRPGPHGPREVRTVKYAWHGGNGDPVVVVVFEDHYAPITSNRTDQLGVMALGIVHDFNNALTSLQAEIELLGLTLADGRRRLSQMDRLLDHAAQLPRQLLAFVQGAAPTRQPVEIHSLLRSLEGLLCGRAGQVTIEYRFAPGPAVLDGDPVQLTQALLNLATNALEAMREQGRLLFETRIDNGWISIAVEDTGPGIPPESLSRIFEPFYTTRKCGTGIGLAIVREVVKLHQGRVSCHSTLGEGTRFTLELPLSGGPPISPRSRVALVLDPAADIAQLSGMILEQGGWQTICRTNLDDASNEPAEVILICASMLHPDGQTWLEAWLSRNPQAQLVVTSTGSTPHLSPSCLARLRASISKPYTAETLLRAVNRAGEIKQSSGSYQ